MYTIKKSNVTNQIVEYLRKNINKGVWQPGQKINSEHEMAEMLGVSRVSVRYALQHLIAIGVLESFQGKGTFVKALPMQVIEDKLSKIYINSEIVQLIQFRRIIETEACKIASAHLTENNIKNLQKYLDGMIQNVNDSQMFIENDIAFHSEILNATGNKLIIQSIACVMEEIKKQHRRFNTPLGVNKAIKYHSAILEYLKKGDVNNAARQMAKHLDELTFELSEG